MTWTLVHPTEINCGYGATTETLRAMLIPGLAGKAVCLSFHCAGRTPRCCTTASRCAQSASKGERGEERKNIFLSVFLSCLVTELRLFDYNKALVNQSTIIITEQKV